MNRSSCNSRGEVEPIRCEFLSISAPKSVFPAKFLHILRLLHDRKNKQQQQPCHTRGHRQTFFRIYLAYISIILKHPSTCGAVRCLALRCTTSRRRIRCERSFNHLDGASRKGADTSASLLPSAGCISTEQVDDIAAGAPTTLLFRKANIDSEAYLEQTPTMRQHDVR